MQNKLAIASLNLGFHISPDITIEFVNPKSNDSSHNASSSVSYTHHEISKYDDNDPYFNPLIYCAITMDDDDYTTEIPSQNGLNSQQEADKVDSKSKKLVKNTQSNENSSFVCNGDDGGVAGKAKKRFSCHLCDKSFGWTTDLKRHTLIHTGERPFKCPLCFATFTRNFLLQKHKTKIHQCLSPNEVSQLNSNVAKNLIEIKMKMREIEQANSSDPIEITSEEDHHEDVKIQ